MYSTSEAAELLGVSPRRVLALIASGDLQAEKRSGVWLLDEASVERRAGSPRLRGRPKAGMRDPSALKALRLKCRDHDVLDFTFRTDARTVVSIDAVHDARYAPAGACLASGASSPTLLAAWIRTRQVPDARFGLATMLRKAGARDASDLLLGSLGLSLSDQYWIVPADEQGGKLAWADVNHFDNDYERAAVRGPDSSTPGVLRKWWEKRGGMDYLVKGSGPARREPADELLATKLYERLLEAGDFVPYTLEQAGGGAVSVCPRFTDATTELNTMDDVMRGRALVGPRYSAYASALEGLGVPAARQKLAKMIVVDYLSGNSDRHVHNLGVLRDCETRTWLGVAPLFDNGMAFFASAPAAEALEEGLYPFESQPFVEYPSAQLALVEDVSWLDVSALEGFGEVIVDVLTGHADVGERYARAVALQFARRVERVSEMAAERTAAPAMAVDVLGHVPQKAR